MCSGVAPMYPKFRQWPTAVHRGASLGGKSCAWYWKDSVPQPTCGYGEWTDSTPVGSTGTLLVQKNYLNGGLRVVAF